MARSDSSVRVTVADPFECTGGLVATKSGKTCANWAREWPALIKRHNPDAVLLYVDDWAGHEPPAAVGETAGSTGAGPRRRSSPPPSIS